jgi:hypothetical protein
VQWCYEYLTWNRVKGTATGSGKVKLLDTVLIVQVPAASCELSCWKFDWLVWSKAHKKVDKAVRTPSVRR